jgi:hypothetical protein
MPHQVAAIRPYDVQRGAAPRVDSNAPKRLTLHVGRGRIVSESSLALRELPPGTSGRVDRSRSGDNEVANVCGIRSVDYSNDLQLDPFRQHVKESTPAAEEHRDLVNLQLVEHARL